MSDTVTSSICIAQFSVVVVGFWGSKLDSPDMEKFANGNISAALSRAYLRVDDFELWWATEEAAVSDVLRHALEVLDGCVRVAVWTKGRCWTEQEIHKCSMEPSHEG